jgi:hypothetical protein
MRLLFALLLLASAAPAAAQEMQSSSPDARSALQRFGRCVANRSPEDAERVLKMDFTKEGYRIALRLLAKDAERPCAYRAFGVGQMRSARLLLAGSLAEGLMARNSAPLNVRLAKAGMLPAPPFRSPTDAIAMCVVRSAPDDTARLFATEVASEAEAQAIKALDLAVKLCSRGQPALRANTEGLRAMLATAAFRNVHPVAVAEGG